jgi:ABC-type nitrate/sulfonate/bicarbonate transport system substrate-binding protein
MKRLATLLVLVAVAALAVTGCSSPATKAPATGSKGATATADATRNPVWPAARINKDTLYLEPGKTYNAADFPKTAMTGAPSNISYFKPVKDEGTQNRVYPATDAKTFKFLVDMNQAQVPQWYYMFDKNGGTLNPAVAKTGFKFQGILDSGAVKLTPNLMLGYYDFAYIPFNTLSTYWSGHMAQYQEFWRGSDYVVVGASYRGGSELLAPPSITSAQQLAGKLVGIPRPDFSNELLLNTWLSKAGLATESAGGNVQIEIATPGYIMNDLLSKKAAAGFVYGKYAAQLKAQSGFKTLVKWSDMGWGTQRPLMLLVVRKDIIAQHPDVVQAVVQANYDASKLAAASDEWRAPSDASFNAYWTKYYGLTQHIQDPPANLINAQASPEFMHGVVDYMTKCDYFTSPYTYSQLVNESFYNKVKK